MKPVDINQTIRKFGYPQSLVWEYPGWMVLLRPNQITLGSMVIAAKSESIRFGDLSDTTFAELQTVVHDFEQTMTTLFDASKFNYLMLMMVDPHVHFHALPRYPTKRTFAGRTFSDDRWPAAPVINDVIELPGQTRDVLIKTLREHWPG